MTQILKGKYMTQILKVGDKVINKDCCGHIVGTSSTSKIVVEWEGLDYFEEVDPESCMEIDGKVIDLTAAGQIIGKSLSSGKWVIEIPAGNGSVEFEAVEGNKLLLLP